MARARDNVEQIQTDERRTLTFYDENAASYALQTESADLTQLYERFLQLIPRGGRILDLGCGGGRDLRAFKSFGFECIGLDPSKRLAKIAKEHSGCEVIVARAQDLCFREEFDGIWACASLLHISRSELPLTMDRVRNSLKIGGVLFLSMQEGNGSSVAPDGRFYEKYSAGELEIIMVSANLDVISQWATSDTLQGRELISWINLLARRA